MLIEYVINQHQIKLGVSLTIFWMMVRKIHSFVKNIRDKEVQKI